MSSPRTKPQGKSGPVSTGRGGAVWRVIKFPEGKADREALIAGLFVKSFERWVATQSEPTLSPFGSLMQNDENDLDFTVVTSMGPMQMELAEFAPLQDYGPRYEQAPKSMHPQQKAEEALKLVRTKSGHQGGDRNFLVIYNTEHAFWLDPQTIERMRRELAVSNPRFERVYYVSVHDLENASVSEIYPGIPHNLYGDADLDAGQVWLPHPTEFRVVRTVKWQGRCEIGGRPYAANFTINYNSFGAIGEMSLIDVSAAVVVEHDID